MPIAERFLRYVQKTETCWLWTGARNRAGYGVIRVAERKANILAHRFAFEFYLGQAPGELLVCHHCDNPSCVNPAHLFLGTDADNMADMTRKGRRRNGVRPAGERHPMRKLSAEDVRVIRDAVSLGKATQAALARRYGIGASQMSRIARGANWHGV